MAVQQVRIDARSFPPGSSREFVDAILRLVNAQTEAGNAATDAGDVAQGAQTVADAQRVRNDQQDQTLSDHNQQIIALQTQVANQGQGLININANAITSNKNTLQVMAGPLSVATELRINNIKVLGGRDTGWTATTGTRKKGGMNADRAFNSSATYNQDDLQQIASGLVEVRQVLAALIAAADSHGLIGL